MQRRSRLTELAGALLLVATACPPAGPTITQPRGNALVDDASVAIEAQVPRRFTADASTVRVDGVDLLDALGLVPPFSSAGGSVAIGGEPVAVSELTYAIPPSGPVVISGRLTGLARTGHLLEVEAVPSTGGAATVKGRAFAVVEPFTLEAEVAASSGRPMPGPVPPPNGGAANATLGESLAAPQTMPNAAGSLRAGFVPAVRARTAAP